MSPDAGVVAASTWFGQELSENTSGGNVAVVAHREILRILAVRWIGLAAIEGRRLLLATASLSVLGYDHDLTEPVIHAWNSASRTEA